VTPSGTVLSYGNHGQVRGGLHSRSPPLVGAVADPVPDEDGEIAARTSSHHSAHTPSAINATTEATSTTSTQRARFMAKSLTLGYAHGVMHAVSASLIVTCSLLAGLGAKTAIAAPPAKKYHFELAALTPKPEVKPEVAAVAQPRIETIVRKAFSTHPQLVGELEGAPDKSQGDAYRKFLAKKGITGAYLVTVEITEASEELVPMEDKPRSQRLVVHVGLHVLGETIPGRTMGFTGDGQATVKVEVGMKVRDRDREFAWDSASQTAVDDALKTCFAQLAKPQTKQ